MFRIFLYICLLNSLIIVLVDGYGQKPPIDYHAIENWPQILNQSISNDGKFVFYIVKENSKQVLYIKGTANSYDKVISNLPAESFLSCEFTEDSRKAIIVLPTDSLEIIDLYSGAETIITNCLSHQITTEGD